MTIQKTTTDLSTLKINYLTKEMYEDALENDEINDNELYITPGSGSIESTDIPTADEVAEFDSSAKMNSTNMTSSEVEDFVDELDVSGINAVDYIVEQGTSGIWTYRKWNSGIAECWGINSASVTCSVISSPWIRGSMNNINFPSSLFNDTPLVMLTGFNAEWVSLASHSKDAISTIYIYTVATGTSTRSVRIHAIGTWK